MPKTASHMHFIVRDRRAQRKKESKAFVLNMTAMRKDFHTAFHVSELDVEH